MRFFPSCQYAGGCHPGTLLLQSGELGRKVAKRAFLSLWPLSSGAQGQRRLPDWRVRRAEPGSVGDRRRGPVRRPGLVRGAGPFLEAGSVWGRGLDGRLCPGHLRAGLFGMEEAQRLVRHLQAAAPPGRSGPRTTPPPPCRDLAALLGPGSGVGFRRLRGACPAFRQEPGGIGRRAGQYESCQVQGLFP